LVDLIEITGIATVIVLGLTLGYYICRDWEKSKPKFHLEKFKEEVKVPVDSVMTLRVRCIKNHVERFSIFIENERLPFIDKNSEAQFERAFFENEGVNYRIPRKINPNRDDKVILKNNSDVLATKLWKDILWSTP
jgi:hypothetical protein